MVEQLTILAPGLLGGSVARAARDRKAARRIVIWARRREVARDIAGQPWCDGVAASAADAVHGADLTVVAAPVNVIPSLVREVAPALAQGAYVTDVGSVKGRIVRECHAAVGERAHFVGSHPMAGSEKIGWEFGSADLFAGRTCFVTPLPETDEAAAAAVSRFWKDIGSTVVKVDPEKHDEIVAHISHLPQVLASVLCGLLAGKDPRWRRYAGGGLRDTTRIAASDPQLWRAILEENRDDVRKALKDFKAELDGFEAALAAGDWTEVATRLARGKDYRDQFSS